MQVTGGLLCFNFFLSIHFPIVHFTSIRVTGVYLGMKTEIGVQTKGEK